MDGLKVADRFLCRSADDNYIIINSITRNKLKTKNCRTQFPIPDDNQNWKKPISSNNKL